MPKVTIDLRSIPACAGEPALAKPAPPLNEVYPRVCGGTTSASSTNISLIGLSPRVRGNPSHVIRDPFNSGSIPACAGEPRRHGWTG